MDVRCRIEMLGALRAVQGEQTHTRFRTHKAASLLAYLALHLQQAHPRERLLDLLWPDMEPQAARDNLSTTLTQLRRQLEPAGVAAGSILVTDKQRVRLNPASVTTDVADFYELLRQARQKAEGEGRQGEGGREDRSKEDRSKEDGGKKEQKADTAALLEQAIALYRGPLLPGWYEEWATAEQTRCQAAYLDALRELTKIWEATGRYAEALARAQQVTSADPYDESGWQAQMRLLVRLRKPSAALQTYERLEELFQRELGARPSAGSRQMAEMIRNDPRAALLLKAEAAADARPSAPLESAEAPAVVSPQAAPTAPVSVAPPLPLQLTRFIGREHEREQIAALLQTPGTRLVSLLGPGGTGKTRLSLAVAAQVAPVFGNRVWFVPLADIPDASLIPSALLHTLRLPADAHEDPLERIAAFLGDSPCLLVLDNLEHLLREMPFVGKNDNAAISGSAGLIRLLLLRAPGLVCLATSRTALRIGGEQEFPIPPLALPPPENEVVSPEHLLRNESVALYVDRARTVRPDFALTAANAAAVVGLCRRLEGMPLALEMAAAWVKTIPPHKMLERLERQLDLLVSRRRDLPPRHQSLRATIEWSYDLLASDLQAFFARLGVFRGGWTLEAAEAVCGQEALYALVELQEHSLIVELQGAQSEPGAEDAPEEEGGSEPRYRMLEPLREFAREKLREREEVCSRSSTSHSSTPQAHAAYFRSLIDEAWEQMDTPGIKEWMNRLETEQENIRVALDWLQANEPESGVRAAGRLWRFWEMRGHAQEGRARLRALLERCESAPPTTDRAQAYHAAGGLAASMGDYANALHHYEQSGQIAQAVGDRYYVAMAKQQCGLAAEELGDATAAAGLLEEAIALYQQLGRDDMVANNQSNLAVLAMERKDYARAQTLLTQALHFQRGAGDLRSIAITLNNLGDVARNLGDYVRARACQAESLQITCEIGAKRGSAYALEAFADIAASEAQWTRAAYFWGAAQRLRETNGCPLTPSERKGFDAQVASVKARLSEDQFTSHWNAGGAVPFKQVVGEALAGSGREKPVIRRTWTR